MDESERKTVLQEISKKTAQKREMPVYDPMDTDYKRLQYVRYADDWICGVIGSKEDAENIKSDIKQFLSEKLHLELSDEKTLITQAKDKAQFLGFEVFVSNSKHVMTDKNCHKKRSMGGHILKSIPKNEIVNARYREKMEERKQLLQSVRAEYAKAAAELDILKAEILCVLRGKSTFSKELLSGMVSEAEAKIATLQEQLTAAQNAYNEGQAVLNALNAQYEDIISWAEMQLPGVYGFHNIPKCTCIRYAILQLDILFQPFFLTFAEYFYLYIGCCPAYHCCYKYEQHFMQRVPYAPLSPAVSYPFQHFQQT